MPTDSSEQVLNFVLDLVWERGGMLDVAVENMMMQYDGELKCGIIGLKMRQGLLLWDKVLNVNGY